MPSTMPDQFSTATLSNLQSQLTIWAQFATKSFEHAGRLAELNVNAFRSAFEETSAASQNLLASKDPQALLAITSTHAQPQLEKALSYSRELGEIVASMQTNFANVVKAGVEENKQNMAKIAETTAAATPDGMLNMASLMKSAIDNVNAGYEQFLKTAQESTEAAQTNFLAGAKTVKKAAERSKHN